MNTMVMCQNHFKQFNNLQHSYKWGWIEQPFLVAWFQGFLNYKNKNAF